MAAKKRGKRAAQPKHAPGPATGGLYRSRIVGQDLVDPHSLKPHPRNWRVHTKHQRAVTDDTMKAIGWIQQIVVNVRTGFMIDGHLRRELAIEAREPLVPRLLVDLSHDEELMALATLDPLSELAATDPDALAELLAKVARPEAGPLSSLLAELEQQAASTVLREVEGGGASRTGSKGAGGQLLRIALAVTDVAVVERAIAKTGQMNRGEAFLLICRQYLNTTEASRDDQANRQHDPGAEGELARGFAQALTGGDAGNT